MRLDDGKLLVQTVDFFTPVVDDPYEFGQIAAANSLSDIYAMGAKPIFALNIVGFPINTLPKKMLTTILQGGADKAKEAGISIVGGHSIDDPEPKYGLVVTGEVKETALITNQNAKPGDVLILTKPLGTGIIATAIKQGKAKLEWVSAAVASMKELNKTAAEVMSYCNVKSATDITGFGLLGHLSELCKASGVSAEIHYDSLPFLPGAKELAKDKIIPGGTKRNLKFASQFTEFDSSLNRTTQLMIADAQTSGGLLVACSPKNAEKYLTKINYRSSIIAVAVGKITKKKKNLITVTTDS